MKKVTFADEVEVKYIDNNQKVDNQIILTDNINSNSKYFNNRIFKLISILSIILIIFLFINAYRS